MKLVQNMSIATSDFKFQPEIETIKIKKVKMQN